MFINLKERNDESISKLKAFFEKEFKVDGDTQSLTIENVLVDESKTYPEDIQAQKTTKLTDGVWAAEIKGDVVLTDKATGKVTKRTRTKLGQLPLAGSLGMTSVRGSEYSSDYQRRLKPGAYTRLKENGELETQFNLAKGKNFKYELNPETGLFTMAVGTSNIPLYPILKAVGVTDAIMDEAWGPEIAEANRKKVSRTTSNPIKNLYDILNPNKPIETTAEATTWVRDYFGRAEMDPAVNQETLGAPFKNLTPNALVAASKKILAVSRGAAKEDNRDSLEYQWLLSPADLLEERLRKKSFEWATQSKARGKLNRGAAPRDVIAPFSFDKMIEHQFTVSSHSNASEQTNPVYILGDSKKTTTMGEGGISSPNAVTMSSRVINPSQVGFLDLIKTPEGPGVGVTLSLALGAKSKDREFVTKVYGSDGRPRDASPIDLKYSVVGLPGQYTTSKTGKIIPGTDTVTAIVNGDMTQVKASSVQFWLQDPKMAFDVPTNLVPFLQADQGNRASMASNMVTQAVPLRAPENPIVQIKYSDDETFEDVVGREFTPKAKAAGKVTKIEEGYVHIQPPTGDPYQVSYYHDYPMNQKTFISTKLSVAVGDQVKTGQVLGDINFTKGGSLAMGTNLNVAYVPWHGLNYNDAIVISESAASKLASEHLYKFDQKLEANTVIDKEKFHAYNPKVYTTAQLDKLDASGVIKKGAIIDAGDPLILTMQKTEVTPEDAILRRFNRALIKPYKDRSIAWSNETRGVVTDVVRAGDKIKVFVKASEVAHVGDKLVNRHGSKGIISSILPDAEMPFSKDTKGSENRRADILLSSAVIPSRMTAGAMLEIGASKIGEAQGKRYITENFTGKNDLESLTKEMRAHGVSDAEQIYDGKSGKRLGYDPALFGSQYFYKLKHTVKDKSSARFAPDRVDTDMQPSKGGKDSALSIDRLTWHAAMGHGLIKNLKEMATTKGESNKDFWIALQTGSPLPKAQVPFVYDKFVAYMQGLGVDVVKDGSKISLVPLTDREILERSNGAIKESVLVRGKDLRPIKDGLFDSVITGGLEGKKFAHITLTEPVINPVFMPAVQNILALTEDQVRDVALGKLYIDGSGAKTTEGGAGAATGVAALSKAMDAIQDDFRKNRARTIETAKVARGPKLDKLNRKIRYMDTLESKGVRASDAYVLKHVPVIPPVFRPLYTLPSGQVQASSLNHLYKNLATMNSQLKKIEDLPSEMKEPTRAALMDSVAATMGLGDSLVNHQNREYKGIVHIISGDQPKYGFFQRKMFRKKQEGTGRAPITLDPTLGPDEVGIPETMAWEIFKPYAVRKLVDRGYKPLEATEALESKSAIARQAIERVAAERPVFLNRSPSLHKFNFMGFQPKIVPGHSIRIATLPMKGFNADIDGDTVAVHVPISTEARMEARRAFPTENLFNPRDSSIMLKPDQDSVLGLYKMTNDASGRPSLLRYATNDEVVRAFDAGDIMGTEFVLVGSTKVLSGRLVVQGIIPADMPIPEGGFNAKSLQPWLKELAVKHRNDYGDIVNKMSQLGNRVATKNAFSLTLGQLSAGKDIRDRYFDKATKATKGLSGQALVTRYTPFADLAFGEIKDRMKSQNNMFYHSVQSGARGSWGNIQQMVMAPTFVTDQAGKNIAVPITRSYGEGLSFPQYMAAMHGARAGIIDRSLSTSAPGEITKQIMAASEATIITIPDCNSREGRSLSVNDS